MSLTTPSNVRELQIKLYHKAKNEPEYRFYMLYDKIYREVDPIRWTVFRPFLFGAGEFMEAAWSRHPFRA